MIGCRKAFHMIKALRKLRIEGNAHYLIKNTYKNLAYIVLNGKTLNACPLRLEQGNIHFQHPY